MGLLPDCSPDGCTRNDQWLKREHASCSPTCRDFVTPIQVEPSGANHIGEDEMRTQEERGDANRKAESNGALEQRDFTKINKRICDARRTVYLQNESEDEYVNASPAGGGSLRGPRQ